MNAERNAFSLSHDFFAEVFGDLYLDDEAKRREDPMYLALTEGLCDLSIVMPLTISNGRIVVEGTDGQNFYEFCPTQTQTQLLFGGVSRVKEALLRTTSDQNDGLPGLPRVDDSLKQPKFMSYVNGGLCDVWASFLLVRLGTVYNLQPAMVPTVCEAFLNALEDLPEVLFPAPISVECRGFTQLPDKTTKRWAKFGTLGRLVTSGDKYQFRMIRRRIKKFARDVMLRYPVPYFKTRTGDVRVRVELHSNCRSASLNGNMQIMTRQWGPLPHKIVDMIAEKENTADSKQQKGTAQRSLQKGSSREWAATQTPAENLIASLRNASAVVSLSEVRLEESKLRMVDPRWNEEFVIGRKIAEALRQPPANGLPTRAPARWVFCKNVEKPLVGYRLTNRQRRNLLKSRAGPLIESHMACHPESATALQTLMRSTTDQDDNKISEVIVHARRRKMSLSEPGKKHMSIEFLGRYDSDISTAVSPNFAAANSFPSPAMPMKYRSSSTLLPSPFQKSKMPSRTPFQSPAFAEAPSPSPFASPSFPTFGSVGSIGTQNSLSPLMPPAATYKLFRHCRFFWTTGCARGNSCRFVHSVDPDSDCFKDVRDPKLQQRCGLV